MKESNAILYIQQNLQYYKLSPQHQKYQNIIKIYIHTFVNQSQKPQNK